MLNNLHEAQKRSMSKEKQLTKIIYLKFIHKKEEKKIVITSSLNFNTKRPQVPSKH